jgi:hypothetical protein
VTTIQVISLVPVATKHYCSDLLISPTSLAQSGTDPHKYLLTSNSFKDQKQLGLHAASPALHTACVQMGKGLWRRWRPVKNVLLAIFFMLLSKRGTCLPISPTSLAQSGIDPH